MTSVAYRPLSVRRFHLRLAGILEVKRLKAKRAHKRRPVFAIALPEVN